MSLGGNLKFQRKKAGLTQLEFAKKTGTSVATLRRWELGETSPDASKVLEIANVLNITPEEIFKENENINDMSAHNLKLKAAENASSNLVYENKNAGVRLEIPPTEDGYKLFWNLIEKTTNLNNQNLNNLNSNSNDQKNSSQDLSILNLSQFETEKIKKSEKS